MALLLKKEGVLTSVQGPGRFGLQRFGVNPRGAMDRTAARLVNILAGNPETEPVLEFHFPGPEIVFDDACTFALGGADFDAELDGQPAPNWFTRTARKASVLRFQRKRFGHRAYLAIAGGFETEAGAPHFDAINGARLRKGQRLQLRSAGPAGNRPRRGVSADLLPAYSASPTVRILPGAEFESMLPRHRSQLEGFRFTITAESDRMGFKLKGPPLGLSDPTELVSAAVTFGTIQLLPGGQLIVLMADHQTSGGYPRIANIISADLPIMGQLGPGDDLAFEIVDIAEAERCAALIEADLRRLSIAAGFGRYW